MSLTSLTKVSTELPLVDLDGRRHVPVIGLRIEIVQQSIEGFCSQTAERAVIGTNYLVFGTMKRIGL